MTTPRTQLELGLQAAIDILTEESEDASHEAQLARRNEAYSDAKMYGEAAHSYSLGAKLVRRKLEKLQRETEGQRSPGSTGGGK